MSIKRGTRVQFIGHEAADEHGNLNMIHHRNRHVIDRCSQLQLSATGKACGGYKGGWVRINWTNPNGEKVGIVQMRSVHIKILEDSGPSRAVQDVMQQCIDLQTANLPEPDVPELSEDEEVALNTALADIREKVHGNSWALREMCDCYDENFRRVFSHVEKLQEENTQLKQQLKDLHDRLSGVMSGQEASTANTTPQSADDWRAVFAAGRRECAERCNLRALSAPPTGKRAQLEKMAWRPSAAQSKKLGLCSAPDQTTATQPVMSESEWDSVNRNVTLISTETAPPPAKLCSCKEKSQCFCKKPNFWTHRILAPQETGIYRDMGGIGQQ